MTNSCHDLVHWFIAAGTHQTALTATNWLKHTYFKPVCQQHVSKWRSDSARSSCVLLDDVSSGRVLKLLCRVTGLCTYSSVECHCCRKPLLDSMPLMFCYHFVTTYLCETAFLQSLQRKPILSVDDKHEPHICVYVWAKSAVHPGHSLHTEQTKHW